MAEQEAAGSVSVDEVALDQSLKRKLDDLEPPPSSDVQVDDGNGNNSDDVKHVEKDEGENGGDDDASEQAKRPRLNDAPDGLASVNGYKVEEDVDPPAGNTEVSTAVESNGAAVDNLTVNEVSEDAVPVPQEANEVPPTSENEQKVDAQVEGSEVKDVEVPSSKNEQVEEPNKVSGDELQECTTELNKQGDSVAVEQQSEPGTKTRKIEIPNNKVGVLIGKAGDTIKYLQLNSGAKIQITRDADADPHAPTRPVEIVGTLESITKAERLIKDVIAEADAGGSPSLVARGFTATVTSGSAEIEMHVPSDKVGLVIGKGGETIRNLQTRSGARIQLIPQSFPGDQSKEKKLKVSGDKKQVEMAKELIKEVMSQLPGRPSQFIGSNYNQQAYRPRGPGGALPPQWGNRGQPQPIPYDHHQRGGPYPSQNQSYGNYPAQGPPRGNFGSASWEHRPPVQGPPPPHSGGGGYDYYGQGGGGHAPNASGPAPQSAHMPIHASGPSMGPPPHSQPNYYGQPRGAEFSHPGHYSQNAPNAQNYGHPYGEPKYDVQGQPQQPPYGGGPGYAPPPQQQYNRPPSAAAHGMPLQGAPLPQGGYAPPTASQPADASYQAPSVSAPQPYAQNVQQHPQQQQYPYASGGMPQAPYGSVPVTNEGYAQPQPQPAPAATGYPPQQQGGQPVAAAYGQQAAAAGGGYPPTSGYGQYPAAAAAAQPGYNDPSAAAAASYGYHQGQVDPSAYAAAQAYSAPAVAQQGYAQPQPAATPQPGGYDQSAAAAAAQSGGYATAPAGAPPGAYAKTVSPQPGYAQYDASQQMYAAPR